LGFAPPRGAGAGLFPMPDPKTSWSSSVILKFYLVISRFMLIWNCITLAVYILSGSLRETNMILIVITDTEEFKFSLWWLFGYFLSAMKSFFACLRYHRRGVSSLSLPSPEFLYFFLF
jgi:hypothetical protein